jgi:hypothetical protein
LEKFSNNRCQNLNHRRLEPIPIRARATLSGLAVDDEHPFSTADQRAFSGVHLEIPAGSARAEREGLGSQLERFFQHRLREAHEMGILVHVRAGLMENLSALLGVYPHARIGEDAQGSLVYSRLLLFGKHLKRNSHATPSISFSRATPANSGNALQLRRGGQIDLKLT